MALILFLVHPYVRLVEIQGYPKSPPPALLTSPSEAVQMLEMFGSPVQLMEDSPFPKIKEFINQLMSANRCAKCQPVPILPTLERLTVRNQHSDGFKMVDMLTTKKRKCATCRRTLNSTSKVLNEAEHEFNLGINGLEKRYERLVFPASQTEDIESNSTESVFMCTRTGRKCLLQDVSSDVQRTQITSSCILSMYHVLTSDLNEYIEGDSSVRQLSIAFATDVDLVE